MTAMYRQCMYKHKPEARSLNNCSCGKEVNVTYSECLSAALVVQRAKRMRRIILPSVDCLTVPYLTTLWHKLN